MKRSIKDIAKRFLQVAGATVGALAVSVAIVCVVTQKLPQDFYTDMMTRPSDVDIIDVYQNLAGSMTLNNADDMSGTSEAGSGVDGESVLVDSTDQGNAPSSDEVGRMSAADESAQASDDASPDTGDEDQSDYLDRGPIEYYSLYQGDETEQMLYSEIVETALEGHHFSDSPYDTSSWVGGYESFSQYGISPDDINNAFEEATLDYPILTAYRTGETKLLAYLDYCGYYALVTEATTDESIDFEQLYRKIDLIASVIDERAIQAAPGSMQAYITSVYKDICEDVQYSDGVDDSIHSNDIYGCLVEGESKCYGDAAAFKYVLDKQHIPCLIATGYASNGERHAWNVVWVGGGWKVCDLTIGARGSNGLPGSVGKSVNQSKFKGCLMDQDTYLHTFNITMNDRCYQLEEFYENQAA